MLEKVTWQVAVGFAIVTSKQRTSAGAQKDADTAVAGWENLYHRPSFKILAL